MTGSRGRRLSATSFVVLILATTALQSQQSADPHIPFLVTAVAFSKDGKRLAVAGGTRPAGRIRSGSGFVATYRLPDLKWERIDSEFTSDVSQVSFADADSSTLIAISDEFALSKTDISTFAGVRFRILGESPLVGNSIIPTITSSRSAQIAFDVNTKLVAFSTYQRFTFIAELAKWTDEAGSEGIKHMLPLTADFLRFFDQGRKLLVCVTGKSAAPLVPTKDGPPWENGARIYDVKSGEVTGGAKPGKGLFQFASFSQDESLVALIGGGIFVYSSDLRKQVAEIRLQESTWAFAISPDNQSLAVRTSKSTVTIYALPSGKRLCALEGHDQEINCLAYSPDGMLAVGCGSVNYTEGTAPPGSVYLWNSKDGKQVAVLR